MLFLEKKKEKYDFGGFVLSLITTDESKRISIFDAIKELEYFHKIELSRLRRLRIII